MDKKIPRNPPWERDELILALDLYFEDNPLKTSDKDPKIHNLSKILKEFNIPNSSNSTQSFRNPNSVYMKLCNFLALDPTYHGTGLKRGSKLDKMIWDEFASNRDLLRKTAISILESKKSQEISKSVVNIVNHEIHRRMLVDIIASTKGK